MASFYWYERDPELLASEKLAMAKYFPQFKLDKLDDGRLYWYGSVNPSGSAGGIWTLQAIYENNHPDNSSYGGSVRVYSVKPDLNELVKAVGKLPHLLRDGAGNLLICTARPEDVHASHSYSTTAAVSLGWAAKWILMVEGWLNGEIGDEIFSHDPTRRGAL